VYAADSTLLRAVAAGAAGGSEGSLHADIARVFVNDAVMRGELVGRQALAAMVEGDALRTMLAAFRRLFKMVPANTAALRRRIADQTVAAGGYPLQRGTGRAGQGGR
jgi:hypothetical protein